MTKNREDNCIYGVYNLLEYNVAHLNKSFTCVGMSLL